MLTRAQSAELQRRRRGRNLAMLAALLADLGIKTSDIEVAINSLGSPDERTAYRETLRTLQRIGVGERDAFVRMPLRLVDAEGFGLRLPAGQPQLAFARGVLGRRGWRLRDRLALLRCAFTWARGGFVCAPEATVADLAAALRAPRTSASSGAMASAPCRAA